MLQCRLPGDGSTCGSNKRIDPAIARELIRPMDRHEHLPTRGALADLDAHDALRPRTLFTVGEMSSYKTIATCVIGMHVDEGLGHMRQQSRSFARARHGVPLIADAASIEQQRIDLVDVDRQAARNGVATNRARPGRRIEAAICEEPRCCRVPDRWLAATAAASVCHMTPALRSPRRPISKSRVPPFSKPLRRACSAKICMWSQHS